MAKTTFQIKTLGSYRVQKVILSPAVIIKLMVATLRKAGYPITETDSIKFDLDEDGVFKGASILYKEVLTPKTFTPKTGPRATTCLGFARPAKTDRACTALNCEAKHYAKNLCRNHYAVYRTALKKLIVPQNKSRNAKKAKAKSGKAKSGK